MLATPRPSIREAQRELTRDRLLDAAREAFEERGYVGVTIDEIIQRAGAARGTFYLYFESKIAIFQAVLERLEIRGKYSELVAQLGQIEKITVAALEPWFEQYIAVYREHRQFHRAIHEARALEPEFAKAMLESLDEDLRHWRPRGSAGKRDSDRQRLFALMNYLRTEGILYIWLVQGLDFDAATVKRTLAEQACAAWGAHG